jgi:hypothetical protein
MKNIVFFLFILLSIRVSAQDLKVDPETNKVTYWEVVDVAGASADDLFSKAKNFGTVDKENILINDNAEKIYSTKSHFTVTYPSPMKGLNHTGIVEYVLTVYAKDGKYKYVFTDFMHKSPKGDGGEVSRSIPACGKYTLVPAGWGTIKKLTAEEAEKLVVALKKGLGNPAKNSVNNTNW